MKLQEICLNDQQVDEESNVFTLGQPISDNNSQIKIVTNQSLKIDELSLEINGKLIILNKL